MGGTLSGWHEFQALPRTDFVDIDTGFSMPLAWDDASIIVLGLEVIDLLDPNRKSLVLLGMSALLCGITVTMMPLGALGRNQAAKSSLNNPKEGMH